MMLEEAKAKMAARQQNFSKRLEQMLTGLDELDNWLLDTLRQGIASLEQQPYGFWKEISARMVDAKLGAIGKRIRNIPSLINQHEDWPNQVLTEFASYFLLIQGLRKMEELPLNVQQDLLTFAGVNIRKEDLFRFGQAIKDTWMVLGQIEGVEDNLNFRRTWILGHESMRYSLILDYAFGSNPYPTNFTPGNVFVAEVVFYPSNTPLRLIIKEKNVLDRRVKRIIGFPTFDSFLDYFAQNFALNPWQQSFPCALEQVRPILNNHKLVLIDDNDQIIPLFEPQPYLWKILSASGGHAINVFGEWSGERLMPLSLTINNQYIIL